MWMLSSLPRSHEQPAGTLAVLQTRGWGVPRAQAVLSRSKSVPLPLAALPQALKDAAALAGLNVLALVNSHSAAALQFGIERDFAAKEQKVGDGLVQRLLPATDSRESVAAAAAAAYTAKQGVAATACCSKFRWPLAG